jgi:hypothetical protein
MDKHQSLICQVDTLTKAIYEALDKMPHLLSFKHVMPPFPSIVSSHLVFIRLLIRLYIDAENIRWHLQPSTPFWQTDSRPLILKDH